MPRILHINSFASSGCVALIAAGIAKEAGKRGYENLFGFGRGAAPDFCPSVRIGSKFDFYAHVLESRLLDNQGLGSKRVTEAFAAQLLAYDPDVVHLHNLHGSYVNYKVLFSAIAKSGASVVWTLHDCWAFTGHCSHFDYVGCSRWLTGCCDCPRTHDYPKSWIRDRSKANYRDKKEATHLLGSDRMVVVTPSKWLARQVAQSFLSDFPCKVIPNGVEFDGLPRVSCSYGKKFKLLAVANIWHDVKGLSDLRELSRRLDSSRYDLCLVGSITEKQKKGFGTFVRFAGRCSSSELAKLYSEADIFLNFTHEDNFPTVNIEALLCGTPIMSFGAGGSAEAYTPETGWVVSDLNEALAAIESFVPSTEQRQLCVSRSSLFSVDVCTSRYVDLYERLLER